MSEIKAPCKGEPIGTGDMAILFDRRLVMVVSTPQDAGGSIGWWADVREVLNSSARDQVYLILGHVLGPEDSNELGPSERVSLVGARHYLQEFRDWQRQRAAGIYEGETS